MASLLNGLSSLGQGISAFAGTAGLEAQKSALATQQMQLADQLATTRESVGRQEAGQIAAGAQERQQTFTAGEGEKTRAAEMEREQARLGSAAALQVKQQQFAGGEAEKTRGAEMERLQATINAPPETIKLLRYLDPEHFPTPSTNTPAASGEVTGGVSGAVPASTKSGSDLTNSLVLKALGQPMPGSDDAIRRAIADGVASDPVFKYKSASDQAGEIKKRLASASASLSSDALDTIADRTIAGDTTALTGLGYGEGGAANRAAAQERITQKLKEKGLGGADLAANIAGFMGEKAGARTAGTREANVGMAVTEAQLFMPLALEASKAVSRTQFPTLNSIIQAAEKGTGDENIVRLAVATNSLVNAYSRAITPSGIPTEGNQARARELLDKAWADGQYAAAIDQLGKEMAAAKQSPIQQQSEQRARISGSFTPATSLAVPATSAKPAVIAPADPSAREIGKSYPLPNGKTGIWRGTGWELAP